MFRGSLRKSVIPKGYCDMIANPEATMEAFAVETQKALWHVYDMLKSANADNVHISQLKVITSNIGRILGFESSEQLLDKDGMTSMDFDTYFEIMKKELILKQKTDSDCTLKPLGERLNEVMRTCWTFCRYERTHKSKAMGSDQCLVLWRLFNFFCETNNEGQIVIPVVLHRDEAAFICKEFIEVTGQKNKEKSVNEIANIPDEDSECLKFGDFQNLFEQHLLEGLSPNAVTYGLTELYEKFLLEILAKGLIWKRGFNVKNWKERWLVLTIKDLKYYVNQSQRNLKGTIVFDKECEIEMPPDRAAHKPNRFVLHTAKKPYEMSAPDLRTKHEWVSAIQTAIAHVGKETNIHQEEVRKRCQARLEKKRLSAEEAQKRKEEAELSEARQRELDEERRKRLEDEKLLQARNLDLEEEKRKREEAEARAREEQLQREADQERLRELEAIKEELERLLAEERQAKKDEEIVRNLQARLLEEEFQKREELERLKQEQEEMLQREREQKAVLQSDREEQERRLREAKEKLEQLELDKAAAAEKMQEASEKLQKAEKDRQIMEHKVKLWKDPVGFKRLIEPKIDPHVTHRGKGAFCEDDFKKRPEHIEKDKDYKEKSEAKTELKKEIENTNVLKDSVDKDRFEDELNTAIREENDKGEGKESEESGKSDAQNLPDKNSEIMTGSKVDSKLNSDLEMKIRDEMKQLEESSVMSASKTNEGADKDLAGPEKSKDISGTQKISEDEFNIEDISKKSRSCTDSGVIIDNDEFEVNNDEMVECSSKLNKDRDGDLDNYENEIESEKADIKEENRHDLSKLNEKSDQHSHTSESVNNVEEEFNTDRNSDHEVKEGENESDKDRIKVSSETEDVSKAMPAIVGEEKCDKTEINTEIPDASTDATQSKQTLKNGDLLGSQE